MIYELQLPDLPPSLNRVGSRGSHMAFWREKKKWEGMLQIALLEKRVPRGVEYIEATATLHFPTKHRRDEGNFRMMLEKALGDVLVSGGYLPDDTPDHYRFDRCQFGETRKPGETWITLEIPDGPA